MWANIVILVASVAFVIWQIYSFRRLAYNIVVVCRLVQNILLNEYVIFPSLILFHLVTSPYTKVEESFNLQATHDILEYGTPLQNIGPKLRATYDHFEFPGVVPRTFVGATVLAGLSRPFISNLGLGSGQLVVRGVLGLLNAAALLRYKAGVDQAFGKVTGRWYTLLQASQFHVMYYASRTLPNMFAFGLSTLAMRELLPIRPTTKSPANEILTRYRRAIYLFVLAGVIFRAEISILLATNLLFLLLRPAISLQAIIPPGLVSTAVALVISVPVDSYFWQRLIWPELVGFFFNAIQGKSSEWGTSPIHAYFTSFLPKVLLNPLVTFLLIPLSLYLPSTRHSANALIIPSLAFVALYSLQPHKEARFVIYVVPPLTTAAAISASYIWAHKNRSVFFGLLSVLICLSILGTFSASTAMLFISSLNYPGGVALYKLHQHIAHDPQKISHVSVHMDVLSCMTGVSRFQQAAPISPFPLLSPIEEFLSTRYNWSASSSSSESGFRTPITNFGVRYTYSKSESPADLHSAQFWSQFHYVLTSDPSRVLGRWTTADTVFGYAGMELLRPGQDRLEATIARNVEAESEKAGGLKIVHKEELKKKAMAKVDRYSLAKEMVREKYTRGWWVGPRMEAKIWILKADPPATDSNDGAA